MASVLVAGVLPAGADAATCAADTASAARIAGLPHRIESGPREIFSVIRDAPDFAVTSPLHVTMRSGGHVFFSGDAPDLPARLFVQLDARDRRALITVRFEQIARDPDPEERPCSMTLRQVVRGHRHFRIASCGSRRTRPRSLVIACGDANFRLVHLRWRHWNRRRARATGAVLYNDCNPYCAAGHFHTQATPIVAFRPRRGPRGHYQYTRLRYRFDGRSYTLHVSYDGYWG